jgi:hypothetical protein
MRIRTLGFFAICIAVAGSGCSKNDAAAPAATAAAAKSGPAGQPGAKQASACDLVTAAEMSAILGGAVSAAPGGNERPPSQTECIYSSAGGSNPYAELEVDWGGGELQSFNSAAKMAGGAAPGSTDPLKGLGDAAYQVAGMQLFVSTGGNLMMIRFLPGAYDVKKARRIYDTAKARM